MMNDITYSLRVVPLLHSSFKLPITRKIIFNILMSSLLNSVGEVSSVHGVSGVDGVGP